MKKKTKRLTIADKNKAFKKLSKAEKRVQIARDVLAQLKTGYLKAKPGVYLESRGLNKLTDYYGCILNPGDAASEMKDILDKDKSCTVCGIGSLFVCAVRRLDNLKIQEIYEFNPSLNEAQSAQFYGTFREDILDI